MVVSKQAKRHKRDVLRPTVVTICSHVPTLTITEVCVSSFVRNTILWPCGANIRDGFQLFFF